MPNVPVNRTRRSPTIDGGLDYRVSVSRDCALGEEFGEEMGGLVGVARGMPSCKRLI